MREERRNDGGRGGGGRGEERERRHDAMAEVRHCGFCVDTLSGVRPLKRRWVLRT